MPVHCWKVVRKIFDFDMFSGMGVSEGLNRGWWFSCVGHCEIDKYADRSYRAILTQKESGFVMTQKYDQKNYQVDLCAEDFRARLLITVAGKRQGLNTRNFIL